MSLNKVILFGNVGKEPEVKYLENGGKVARFSLATTDRYTDKNGEKKELTEWHSVCAWDKRADFVEKYVKGGTPLIVEGRLRTRAYQKDGGERYVTEIVSENIQLAGKKPDTPTADALAKEYVQKKGVAVSAPQDDNDDLPF